jgi:putative ABC transport system permease protein
MEHDHAPFVVTGVLEPTGSVIDRLILTSVESVWGVHGIEVPEEHDDHDHGAHEATEDHDGGHDHGAHEATEDHDGGHDHGGGTVRPVLEGPSALAPEVTAVLVSYRSPAAALRLPAAINRQTALQAAVPAQETARFLTLFDGAIAGARLFGWLIAGAGALSIFTVLLSAARAREGDMALLRVMGATRWQVFGTVLLEGVLTAGAGALLGMVLAHVLIGIAARSSLTLSGLGLSGLSAHPAEGAILGGALLLGAFAALLPAARVFRQDLATTLARGQ